MSKSKLARSPITLRDLHKFIQLVEINEVGEFDPAKSLKRHAAGLTLQVYAHRDQVNFCLKHDEDLARSGLSTINFVFGGDRRVDVFGVNDGYADYDHPAIFDEDDDFADAAFPTLAKSTNPSMARRIIQIVIDVLQLVAIGTR